jgi:DNA-binding NtrC family response regulator
MMLKYEDTNLGLQDMRCSATDKSSEQMPENEKPTVLVFGIDKEVKNLLRTIIDLWNYDYAEAETVEEAIRIASQKSPDLVLMDTKITFPDSFAEMHVMQKSDFLKNSPFILLSGHVQNDVRLSAIAAGAVDFFVKPINLDLLEETMKMHIAKYNRIKYGT